MLTLATQDVQKDAPSHIECRQKINFYKSYHKKALLKIKKIEAQHKLKILGLKETYEAQIKSLKKELEKSEALVKKLKKFKFANKSEKKKNKKDGTNEKPAPKTKNRGQQPGSKGHGKRVKPKELPVKEEVIELPDNEKKCSDCGNCFEEMNSFEESEITETEVRGYTRIIKRKKYKTCGCNGTPKIIVAPVADRVFSKSQYGVSIWHKFLANKFILAMPITRTAKELFSVVGEIPSGTIVGGFKKISPLLDPLIDLFHDKLMSENYFHCDETYWKVFEKIEGKETYNWYVWGVFSESVRYYHLSKSRATYVLEEIFTGLDLTLKEVVISCDRYSAYKCFAKSIEILILAFCWAHCRRDFLEIANSYPALMNWSSKWVRDIGKIYHLNKKRLLHWDRAKPLSQQNPQFQKYHKSLVRHLKRMKKNAEKELSRKSLHDSKRKVLKSLMNHWDGYTAFIERPFIRLDNNTAEREVRICVIGRKNFYGSGSIWSAVLAGQMYTFIKTYELWGLDASNVLYAYLDACAKNDGKAPAQLDEFLPWKMSEERLDFFKKPLVVSA
jgi:transposase